MASFGSTAGFQGQGPLESSTRDTCTYSDQQQPPLSLQQAYKRAVAAAPAECTISADQHSAADTRQQPPRAERAVLRQRQLQHSNATNSISGDSGNSQELNRLLSDCLAEMGCVPVADYKASSKGTLQHGHSQIKPLQQQQQLLLPGSRAIGVAPPMHPAASSANTSSHTYSGLVSPSIHQQMQPFGTVTSTVQTSLSNDVAAGRDLASSGTYNRELLQSLQQDIEWQAQQLRLKDQQLNEMIQQHELLLRKYLEVKAANEALLQQQRLQPARERPTSDNSTNSSPHMQQQQSWTPMGTPRAGMSLLSSVYPAAVQPATPGEYLPVLISQSGTVPMSPSPPPLAEKSSKPAPRRHFACTSLQQLEAAGAGPTAACSAAAVGTPGRTAFMAVSSLQRHAAATTSLGAAAVAAAVAYGSPKAAKPASPTTAILDSAPDVSASLIKRPSKSHSQVCLTVPEYGVMPALAAYSSGSSRAADALISPRVGLRIRSISAHSSVPWQVAGAGVARLLPTPPTEGPGHATAESSRAGKLREPSPGRVLSCARPQ